MKMKMLVIILFVLVGLILCLKFESKEINYTILGDKNIFSNNLKSVNFSDLIYKDLENINKIGFYSKDFIKEDIRTIDVINDIENNYAVDNIRIQNIIKRTNLMIISIGNNEINYKLSKNIDSNNEVELYNYLDSVINDVKILIEKIRNLNNEQIIFLGYYNDTNLELNDKYYKYINDKLNTILKKYDIVYINMYDILNKNDDYLTKTSEVYVTNEGNMAIYHKITSKIKDLYLHKNN